MARRRAQWSKYRERIAPSRLVFIDETWTKTNMAPLRGWAPRGQRIKAKVPHGRWQTMTFLAALRHDRITAPWFFDGPINGEAFRLYVETSWSRHYSPPISDHGQSRPAQSSMLIRRSIRAAGAHLFFLPKYSPDLNPIEQFFSKLKHWLRKAAKRTTEAVYHAIGPILDTVSSTECAHYFANAGYD